MNVITRGEEHNGLRLASTIDLQRGQWSYVVITDKYNRDGVRVEVMLQATNDVLEAFRIARKHVDYQILPKDLRWGVRRGLAYGFIIDGPKLGATIVPTPRYDLRGDWNPR